MLSRYSVLLSFLVLPIAACEPELQDGQFACVDGRCPDGFVCRGDDRCYGPGAPLAVHYAACAEDDECASGTCSRAPTMDDEPGGQCTSSCTMDAECEQPADGATAICTMGSCFRVCDETADCSGDTECLSAPGREPLAVCAIADNPAFEGRIGCTGDGQCSPPTRCRIPSGHSTGICAWPCAPGLACPGNSECRDWPGAAPDRLCLARCTMAGQCMGGAKCLGETMPTTPFCVGSSWTGLPP